MALITAAQVIATAAVRNIDVAHIKAADIATAEIDYIKRPLGEDLYNAVVLNTGSAYTTFITTYVIPVRFWYIFKICSSNLARASAACSISSTLPIATVEAR